MADCTGGESDFDFAVNRGANFNVFDDERFAKGMANGGFDPGHRAPLVE
jgi:hypothetical protein